MATGRTPPHAGYLEARRLLLIGRLDEAERALAAVDLGALAAGLAGGYGLVAAGHRDAAPADEGGARRARPGAAAPRGQAGIPALVAEVERAARVAGHAGGAPDRARRGEPPRCSTRSRRCWPRRRSSSTPAATSCGGGAPWSRSRRRPVLFALARSLAEAWPGGRLAQRRCSRGPSGRSTPMNRIARGCGSRSGGCARRSRRWPGSARRSRGFVLVPRRARGSPCWRRPSRRSTPAVLALLADGEAWSSSALALALGASPRTVQRALEALARAGKVQSFGRGRARRWMAPPVPGFPTSLLLPGPLPGG